LQRAFSFNLDRDGAVDIVPQVAVGVSQFDRNKSEVTGAGTEACAVGRDRK
jgi:hypothetical protein